MATNRPLPGDLTVTGMDQQSMYQWMANITDAVNELMDDHATNKTTMDESRTAIMELIDDHDTNQTHLANIKTLLNDIRTYLTGDRLWSGNPTLAIDTNFDAQASAACVVSIDGTLATVAAATTCDTGTTATFPTGTWGIFLVTSNSTGTLTATWDDNSTAGYASEALAIAALPAAPASQAPVGYVTVQAHATGQFLAGTDALQGGTGGDAAQSTNYYNLADPLSTVSAAVSTSEESALAAGDPTASAAALSDSTNLTLLRS